MKIGQVTTTEGRNGSVDFIDGSKTIDVTETTPEQLFATAVAACYHSALGGVLDGRGIEGKHRVDVEAGFNTEAEDRPLYLKFKVAIEGVDEADALRFAEYADKVCPYTKAVEGNLEKSFETEAY